MKDFIERSFHYIKPGDKYGKLTILKTGKKLNTYRYYALCQCDCGSPPKYIRIDCLESGNTKGCGCLHKTPSRKTHEKTNSPVYYIYTSMIARCYHKQHPCYHLYGGRGIKVCDRWLNILNFVEDMEPSFKKGLSLDRINNDKGYSPENCRWATQREQMRNTRSNRLITHNNKTLSLVEWSEILDINYQTLRGRLNRGWSFKKAIIEPISTKFHHKNYPNIS